MAFTSSYTDRLIQQSQFYYGVPSMEPGLSGSFSGSFQGDGSQLTGVGGDPFPFTGDAQITGSLIISGSFIPQGPGVSHISNVSIGRNAGPDLTSTGQENVIIGSYAGNKLDDEDYAVLIGSFKRVKWKKSI